MKWITRFFADFIGVHLDGLRAMRGLLFLFVAIVLWEFAQHVIEVRIGMFESREAARALGGDGSRMLFGWVKMMSVYVGGFFVIRHLFARRGDTNLAPVATAFARYLPYMVYMLAIFAALFYARSYAPEASVDTIRAVLGLSQIFVEPLLMAWIVAAATDGRIRNPLVSAKQTGLLYLYALPLFFFARLPVSLAHQQLNSAALGREGTVLWSMLALDAIVVGLIVAIIPAISVRVAAYVRERGDRGPSISMPPAKIPLGNGFK